MKEIHAFIEGLKASARLRVQEITQKAAVAIEPAIEAVREKLKSLSESGVASAEDLEAQANPSSHPEIVAAASRVFEGIAKELAHLHAKFMLELIELERAYKRNDIATVDAYIENELGLSPRGLCFVLARLELDEETMR